VGCLTAPLDLVGTWVDLTCREPSTAQWNVSSVPFISLESSQSCISFIILYCKLTAVDSPTLYAPLLLAALGQPTQGSLAAPRPAAAAVNES
jgi:hypothetical protein